MKASRDSLHAMSGSWSDEEPIRRELFNVERMEQFAVTLAAEDKVGEGPQQGRLLLPRFEENGRLLMAAYRAHAHF